MSLSSSLDKPLGARLVICGSCRVACLAANQTRVAELGADTEDHTDSISAAHDVVLRWAEQAMEGLATGPQTTTASGCSPRSERVRDTSPN